MLDHERVGIEAACQRLAAAFCQTSDANQADLYEALFTADARFVRPGSALHTARAIADALRGRSAATMVRHYGSNSIVDVVDSSHARGAGNLVVVRHNRGTGVTEAPVYGDYRDEYVLTDRGWKIAVREVSMSFDQSSEAAVENSR
jgi:hypothetical protein